MTSALFCPTSDDMSGCKDLWNVSCRNVYVLAIFAKHPNHYISTATLLKDHKDLQSFFPSSSLYENIFKLKSLGFLECRPNEDDQRQMEYKVSAKGVYAYKSFLCSLN